MSPNRRQVIELLLLVTSALVCSSAAGAGDPCAEAVAKLNAFDRSYDSQMDDLRQRRRDDRAAISQAQQQQSGPGASIPHYFGEFGVPDTGSDDAEADLDHVNSARRELDDAKHKLERQRDEACALNR